MRPPSLVALSALLVLAAVSCGQPTWDEAMQAGEAALQRGHYREAEQIFSVAVHKAEEFGRHDRRVAVTLAHLAQTYSAQGKFVEAEPVYLEALKIYQEVHGENHLDVAATLNNLGVLHRKHGSRPRALQAADNSRDSAGSCFGSGTSVSVASVNSSTLATETAFSRAVRTTLVGSIIPAATRSQ